MCAPSPRSYIFAYSASALALHRLALSPSLALNHQKQPQNPKTAPKYPYFAKSTLQKYKKSLYFCIFSQNYLHISKKSSNFALGFIKEATNNITTTAERPCNGTQYKQEPPTLWQTTVTTANKLKY